MAGAQVHILPVLRSTVLVVDDQATGRALLGQIARNLENGIQVESFEHPGQALAWADARVADLVLVDFQMPEMDGIELVRSLRLRPGYAQVPMVMVTVNDSRSVRYEALEAGVTDFLIRPLDGRECVARCRNLLTLRRQQLAIEDRRRLLEGAIQEATRDIRERESRYRAVVETSTDGFWVLDRGGRILDVNDRYVQESGYSREQLLGMTVYDIVAGASAEDIRRKLQGSHEREAGIFETRHRRKDGSIWPVEVSSVYLPQSGGRFCNFLRNIADRKQAEKAHATLAAIVQHTNDAIIGRALDGSIISWNAAAERLLGYTAAEVIGRECAALYPTECQHEIQVNRERIRAGQTVPDRDTVRIAKDGRRIHVTISVSPIKNNDGVLMGTAVILRDNTERKRLEESHLRAQKLQSVGTLAAGIAHDFNNILVAVRGNAELATKALEEQHPAMVSLAEIGRAGVRASDLVRRILAFARPREPRREIVDLAKVVEEVLALLRATIPPEIGLATRFGGDVPAVDADAGQLHEAVVNLTTNAVHAMRRRSGSIDYVLEGVDLDDDDAAALRLAPGRYARLTVRDEGCGMDEGTRSRIFDAFYTTKPAGEGTGLGLSVVYGILQSHGGAVAVDSMLGEGSSFHLYFPAVRKDEAKAGVPEATGRTRLAGKRLIFVDDDEAIVSLARSALEPLGLHVLGFTDPRVALEVFASNPARCDLVVTDLSMPHMTGFDFAKRLLAVRPGLPIFLTSGDVSAGDGARARDVGIREVVLKPGTVEELAAILAGLFELVH